MKRPSKTFLSDLLKRHWPTREGMAENRWLAPIAHRFLIPELWRFTRRSVPRGVGLGLFCAFIVPLGQVFLAAFLALPLRANVPLACLITFVTNPFTLPFWLVTANRIGVTVLRIDTDIGGAVLNTEGWARYVAFFETAGITVVGFVVLAILCAALGFFVASAFWRFRIVAQRRNTLRARKQDGAITEPERRT